MNYKKAFLILWVAALTAVSLGQGMRGGMGNTAANPPILLQYDEVREELQLTDDQKSQLFDMQSGIRSRFTEVFRSAGGDQEVIKKAVANIVKKITEDVNKILTPGQQTRLKEIAIQDSGFNSVTIPDIQKSIGLKDDQKAKIADLTARQDEANKTMMQKLRDGDLQWTDVQAAGKKNLKIMSDEIGKLLSQAQKDKLKTLGGKTFQLAPEHRSSG